MSEQFSLTHRDARILGECYPPFADKIKLLLPICWEKKLPIHLTQGFRYFGEQDELYKAGKSNAKGGNSYHNFGLAVDFCFDSSPDSGIQDPYLEPFEGSFKAVADSAKELGLEPGFYWKSFIDKPHIQAKITIPIDDLKCTIIKGGIYAVYRLLNEKKGIL